MIAVGVAEHDVHVVLGEEHRDPLFARELRRELHQAVARARRHAGGGLVHQQQPRRAGERQRQLDALRVAVRERRAALAGESGHAHALEQRIGFGAHAVGRPRGDAAMGAGMRQQRELDVLAHGHRREGRGDLERPADAHPRDGPRRQPVDPRAGQGHGPGVGRELPVDEIEARRLAGAVGADQRDQLAGGHGERDVVHHVVAAEGLGQAVDAKHRGGHAVLRRSQCDIVPPIPDREHDDDEQDRGAEHGAPVFGGPRERVRQPRERGRSEQRSGQRVEAAQQHHHQRVDRARNGERLRRNAALREGVEPAGKAREAARRARRPSTASSGRRCRWPRPAAANRGRRAANSRAARARSTRAPRAPPRSAAARTSNRPACRTSHAAGQTPTIPLEPPVTASHWNAIDQTICANASVSIAM